MSERPLTLFEALLPLLTLAALLAACAAFLELNGQMLVLVILASAAVAGVIARMHGATWDDIQRVTGETGDALPESARILLKDLSGAFRLSWLALIR